MIVLKEILETKCQEKCHIRREKRKSHTPGVVCGRVMKYSNVVRAGGNWLILVGSKLLPAPSECFSR